MDPSSATSAARVFPLATEVAATSGPGPLRHVLTTGSTNADLAAEAERGASEAGVLVADHQTSGRGRLDRRWMDEPGEALLVSLRVPSSGPTEAGQLVRALGAAARAAVDELCAVPVLAKWPNDLVVTELPAPGKLAGVLGQFVEAPVPCVVIGIGVNVSPVASRGLEGRSDATSIAECGGPDDRDQVLAVILRAFAERRTRPDRVLEELRLYSATIGSQVRVELPAGRMLTGRAVDLTPAGALVLEDDERRRHEVHSGDVVHLHPG